MMTPYREMRTITGQKMFVRETREQRMERILFRIEVVMAPIVAVLVWAIAARMI